MYFWKTDKLAILIRQGGLTEKMRRDYYLATSILTIASIYFLLMASPRNRYAVLAEAIGILLVTVFGILITFSSNGGTAGSDYLGRIVALSLPLQVKAFVMAALFGILLGAYAHTAAVRGNVTDNVTDSFTTAFSVVIQAWVFWRLQVHLRFISA